ncbi:MAG: hypothetical protein H6695_15555 [Deferribacteres bacterium]|nr:hypothetical protein [candidate division KSB1 bacterium]MCB9511605.1 hypothetical protein [Deferribacteres bacterium]
MIKFNPTYRNFHYLNGDVASFNEDIKFVFVLMPFGRSETEKKLFRNVFFAIKRIAEQACFHGGVLSCSRADLEDGLIVMDDVCKNIKKAGLAIFDISIPNANVYYELGLACALDKKILLTFNSTLHYEAHPEEKIPFDINQFRYVEYQSIQDLESKLKRKVESLIRLEDYKKVDLHKIYQKVQRITRHFELDSISEQIIEDWEITDYEIDKACDALDKYWNDPKLEAENFSGIAYHEVEIEIRNKIRTDNYSKVKAILRAIYWNGHYQSLIAVLERLPAELYDIKRHYRKKAKIEDKKE